MKVFAFRDGDSFLHRLNPLTKLAFAVVMLLVLTIVADPATPLILTVLLLLTLAWLGRVRLSDLVRILIPSAILGFGIIWTTALFYVSGPTGGGRVLWALGPLSLTDQGLAYALTIFLRLQGFLAASLLFVLTTDPTDFIQALIQKLRLSYRFGYGTLAAYHFVPQFDTELATIRAAQRIRVIGDGGGPIDALRRYVGYMIPLLAGAVRKAERVALAMDARGFGACPTRTYYHRSVFTWRDLVFGIGAVAALGGVLATLHALGWLGRLIPPFIA
jgi:energy-coupling factor transport system permease protein